MVVGLLSGCSLCEVASADRPSVESTLKEMERRVLKGDGQSYLELVARDDADFRKEQENWAADLAKHRPIAFTLAIGEDVLPDSPAIFGGDESDFELVLSWTMPGLGDDGGNLTRTTSFPVRFVREPESGAWLYSGERWQVVESKASGEGALARNLSARVKYMEGFEEAAKSAAELMPEVRRHVHEGFEISVERVQEVKLYPTMRHLQASIYLSYNDPLSGWNEPGESIKLVVSPKAGAGRLKPLLAHEYGHVATFEMGPKATDAPWWVLEGVAELASERYSRSGPERIVRSWARDGTIVAWSELSDFRRVPADFHTNVYKQGQHMIGYISERFGRAKRNAWLRALANGASIGEATQSQLGVSFEQMDTDWRATLIEPKRAAPEAPK